MKIQLLTFGQVADIINDSSVDLDDTADTNALKHLLENKYHQLKDLKYAIAIDKKIVNDNTLIQPHSVVALLPPFSGG